MTTLPNQAQRAAEGFLEANRRFAANEAQGLTDALQYLVELAVECLDACDWAAITIWPEGKPPRSPAVSDSIASRVDQIQYTVMEGPCLEAAADDTPVSIPDLTADERWPRFSAAVVAELPVRAALAFPLGDHPERMALNLFSARPHAFHDDRLSEAAVFATQATGLLLHAQTAQRAAQFEGAIDSNRQIGMAIGVLMGLRGVTAGDAFDLLRQTSNRLKRKVRDVALDVIESGTLPE